jgi:hypothetical protein
MLSPSLTRIGITAVLGLHAVAHANALVGLVRQAFGAAQAFPAQLWPTSAIDPRAAAVIGLPLWLVATAAFALAAASFWGMTFRALPWRRLAIAGAIASLVGVGVFFGTWPGAPDSFYALLNTAIAAAVDLVVLAALLWWHWPPQPMFGR